MSMRGIWAPLGDLPETTLPQLSRPCGVCGGGMRWYSVTGPSRYLPGDLAIEFVALCGNEMCDAGPTLTAERMGWRRG